MLDVAVVLETSLIIIHIKAFIYQSFITCKAVRRDVIDHCKLCDFMSLKKREAKLQVVADLYFKVCSFHRLRCIFNYLGHLVLLILPYRFCYRNIVNGRNEF